MGASKHPAAQQLPLKHVGTTENCTAQNVYHPNISHGRARDKSAGQTMNTRYENARRSSHIASSSMVQTDTSRISEKEGNLGSRTVKVEHRDSQATRRGPMDEMRQLVRILTKLMPKSEELINITGEDPGRNRISEDQIKSYLRQLLGEAPQPEWGVPEGWGQYLANLFNWALGNCFVSADCARKCARRSKGRPWEAVWDEVHSLGVFPERWPYPLTLAGVRAAQRQAQPAQDCKEDLHSNHTPKRCSTLEGSPDKRLNSMRLNLEPARFSAPSILEASDVGGEDVDSLLDSMLKHAQLLLQHPEERRGDVSKQIQVLNAVASAFPGPAQQYACCHEVNMGRHENLLARFEGLLNHLEVSKVMLPMAAPNASVKAPTISNPMVQVQSTVLGKRVNYEVAIDAEVDNSDGNGVQVKAARPQPQSVSPCTLSSKGNTANASPSDAEPQTQDIVNNMSESQFHFLQSLHNSQEGLSQDGLPWIQVGALLQSQVKNSQSLLDGKVNGTTHPTASQ